MTVTAQSIISRVRTQLVDTNVSIQHWSDTELLRWLSDGQRTLVSVNPSASAKRAQLPLAAGTKQTLPSDAHMLLDIERNIVGTAPGRAIRRTDQATLEAFDPDWHTKTQTVTVKHYLYNPLLQDEFYVYPPNDGTGKAEVIYSVMPPDLAALTDSLVVQDIYQTALFDYVMFRAHQKDSDFAAGGGVAQTYLNAFTTVISGEAQGQGAQQPNSSGAS